MNAHEFLIGKGIKRMCDSIPAFQVEIWLNEFANLTPIESKPEQLRPLKGLKVKWKGYDCKVQRFKVRDKVAKIVQDHDAGCHTMPYQYYWVDWNEIGF